MKVSEILSEPRKWWSRNSPGHARGSCLVLAVGDALALVLSDEVIAMLADITGVGGSTRDEQLSNLFDWNDAPERTFAEVHAASAEFDRRWSLRAVDPPPEPCGGRP